MKYSLQSYKHTTDEIDHHPSQSDDNKAVIICSTASKVKDEQTKLDSWLDMKNTIDRDSVLVIGELEAQTKFAYTTEFRNTIFGSNDKPYSSKKFVQHF